MKQFRGGLPGRAERTCRDVCSPGLSGGGCEGERRVMYARARQAAAAAFILGRRSLHTDDAGL